MGNKESYFDSALSNFIFDFACGGAIRHLADQGYSSAQIHERLHYPVSYERVREAVTAHYLERGILLKEEPSKGKVQERYVYVQDHGRYGKTSFRKVPVKPEETVQEGIWVERSVNCGEAVKLLSQYAAQSRQSGNVVRTERAGQSNYVSCDYGKEDVRDKACEVLNERQREYLQGIRWERRRMYHLLNARMREIVIRLCEKGIFDGRIYLGAEWKIITVTETEEK